ncbi:MAG TPA: flagellar basal-body rod protein FlgF [Bryobacteraceae bacterium]|nr:flagellar basal-body rod protein FlgF [Bryobacteraceae bacterium]
MDSLLISAASGMRARMESLDLLANNIANANTAGFKTDREFYNLYVAPEAADGEGTAATTLPVIEKHWTDFSEGALAETGNRTDLAISGKGFFVVQGPNGPLYTRNGSFRVGPGGRLQTQDGLVVRGQGGAGITIDEKMPFSVKTDGSVEQSGQTINRLQLADFDNSAGPEKVGSSYFRLTDVSGIVREAEAAQVQQGRLEGANSSPAEAAVRLVDVMRQFDMLQRAAALGAEMNRKAVEEVARVSS